MIKFNNKKKSILNSGLYEKWEIVITQKIITEGKQGKSSFKIRSSSYFAGLKSSLNKNSYIAK